MTIIAAYSDETGNWIASDSLGTYKELSWDLGTKLIYKENYTLGNAGSYRTGDLIEECDDLPSHINDLDDLREFRDTLRALMLADGSSSEAAPEETVAHDVYIVIVSPYGIFSIDEDYQIHRRDIGYHACGTGTELAMGSMLTSKLRGDTDGSEVVRTACEIAIAHCPTCGGRVFIDGWERND